MSITTKDIFDAIKKTPMKVHQCVFCGYWCGYVHYGEKLFYDSGCECTDFHRALEQRDLKDLDFLLDPKNGHDDFVEKFIEKAKGIL